MIGSLDNAILAVDDDATLFSNQGSARNVYLIDGVIYKVDIDEDANLSEFANLTSLTDLPEGIAIPKFTLYETDGMHVMAMEYIDGVMLSECNCEVIGIACDCLPHEILPDYIVSDLNRIGMTDLAYGNIIASNGIYYIVDADILSTN